MKKYRRVYIEITNRCPMHCSFCIQDEVKRKDMTLDEFKKVIDQLEGRTKAVYYHVLGEPLLHPDLEKMMEYAKGKGILNAITTNGLLLSTKLGKWKELNVVRINLSLTAYFDQNNQKNKEMVKELMPLAHQIQKETGAVMFYRLWDMENQGDKEMLEYLEDYYQCKVDPEVACLPNGFQIADYFRVQMDHKFVWPTHAEKGVEEGFCQGLRTHFGILSNGDVVPCCLDGKGEMILGNIFNQSIDDILNGELAQSIYRGFTEHHATHPVCMRCEYKSRFME